MLLTQILTTLALLATTFAKPPATTNTSSLVAEPGPKIVGGYSPQEREQIHQAHLDAITLVRTAISNVAKEQYDRIFVKYFNIDDHQLVWGKSLDGSSTNKSLRLTIPRCSHADHEKPTLS
jgi:hypothetical protein